MSFQGRQISRHVVHVGVGEDQQQVAMPLERILHLHGWDIAIAAEGPRRAVGQADRDQEIVDPQQAAFDLLT